MNGVRYWGEKAQMNGVHICAPSLTFLTIPDSSRCGPAGTMATVSLGERVAESRHILRGGLRRSARRSQETGAWQARAGQEERTAAGGAKVDRNPGGAADHWPFIDNHPPWC